MKYFEKVDGLRFVAISFVLIQHFAHPIGKYFSAGYFGVDLFLVISGFLVTGILLKPNELGFRGTYFKFLGRRTLRIFPIYYGTLFLLWLLGLAAVRDNIFYLSTYTFNYVMVDLDKNPINHFWSLSVEEQFYLTWPLVVIFLKYKPKLLLCITILMIGFGYGQTIYHFIPALSKYNYVGIHTRMASLALGALGAIIVTNYTLPKRFFQNKYVEYFVLATLIITLTTHFQFKVLLLGLISFYLTLKAAYFNFNLLLIEKFLKNKSVIKVGILSYGIYVFHLPLGYYATTYLFDPIWLKINFSDMGPLKILRWHSWILKLPLYSILSFCVAHFSFQYFEKPILKLKDRFFDYEMSESNSAEKESVKKNRIDHPPTILKKL